MTSGRMVATGTANVAAVASASPAQAVNPASTTQIRAVPRSRIVSRSVLYSSNSRGVSAANGSLRFGRPVADRTDIGSRNSAVSVSGPFGVNSLAVYELSATIFVAVTITYGFGVSG
jgi:hypothetical protein